MDKELIAIAADKMVEALHACKSVVTSLPDPKTAELNFFYMLIAELQSALMSTEPGHMSIILSKVNEVLLETNRIVYQGNPPKSMQFVELTAKVIERMKNNGL